MKQPPEGAGSNRTAAALWLHRSLALIGVWFASVFPLGLFLTLDLAAMSRSWAGTGTPAPVFERSYEDVLNWKVQMRPSSGKVVSPICVAIANLQKTESYQYAAGFLLTGNQESLLFDLFSKPLRSPNFIRIFSDDRLIGSIDVSSKQDLTEPSGILLISKFPDHLFTTNLAPLLSSSKEMTISVDGSDYIVPTNGFQNVASELHQCAVDSADDLERSHSGQRSGK